MRSPERARSEAAAFHAETGTILGTTVLTGLAVILVLGVLSAVLSLAHMA